MSEPTMLLTVVYDPSTQKFLGKHAQWVTAAQLAADPPVTQEDLLPEGQRQEFPVLAISYSYRCINHVLHCCTATRCTSLGVPC